MIETLYLTGAVVAFTLLMVSLFIIKLWSDQAPSVTPVARPKVTPARRPDMDLGDMRKAA
jgi:hypothetical protein